MHVRLAWCTRAAGGLRRGMRWHPLGAAEALSYGILRRMSTDEHGAAPCWAGAVLVGGLVGSELGARQCAEVTRVYS